MNPENEHSFPPVARRDFMHLMLNGPDIYPIMPESYYKKKKQAAEIADALRRWVL